MSTRSSSKIASSSKSAANVNEIEGAASGNENDEEADGNENDDNVEEVESGASNLENLILQVPSKHHLLSLSEKVTNGNNQRRCAYPGCSSRPNKYCSGCSDVVLGNKWRFVCFCYTHFSYHIASQCYITFTEYNKKN